MMERLGGACVVSGGTYTRELGRLNGGRGCYCMRLHSARCLCPPRPPGMAPAQATGPHDKTAASFFYLLFVSVFGAITFSFFILTLQLLFGCV